MFNMQLRRAGASKIKIPAHWRSACLPAHRDPTWYSLFGHTAIRVRDSVRKMDIRL